MRKKLPDSDLVRNLFDYSKVNRGLIYKPRKRNDFKSLNHFSIWNSKWLGKKAGNRSGAQRNGKSRYVAIKINGELYYEHLLVLVWHGIKIPFNKEVDHIDNDKTNNQIENLRLVDRSLNCQRQNRAGVPSENMGARKCRNKLEARATINGKRYYLGSFNTCQEALKHRVDFIEKIRGEELNPKAQV